MAYLYLNPGHGNLFPNKSQMSYSTQTSSTYTRTGVAFGNCGTCYLPNPPAGTKEIWAKFDNYNRVDPAGFGFYIKSSSTSCDVSHLGNYTYNYQILVNGISKKSVYPSADELLRFFVHLKSNATDGLFEVYEKGILVYSFNGDVLHGEDVTELFLYSNVATRCFSNIIVSDTEIGKTENVITLPVSATDATMTDNGDGSYSATSAGEYVKQTIDAATLKQTYDANKTRITGVMAAGRPAYYDGEGLTNMECLKSDVAVGESELTTSNAYSIMYGETLNNATIDELAANIYGWRAK